MKFCFAPLRVRSVALLIGMKWEIYGKEQINWFRKYFPYKKGIPSHDTISRLFARLVPEEFCKYFTEWVQTLRKSIDNIDKEVIAIYGKAVKGSAKKSKGIKSLYYVSAYASENELVLCQEVADEKSNEIRAVPKLLDMIECGGTIITVDALNCQTKIIEKVVENRVNYLFAIKSNQGELYEQIVSRFSLQKLIVRMLKMTLGTEELKKESVA